MISIYSSFSSPRLSYVLDFVFSKVLLSGYEIDSETSRKIHIWYSSEPNESHAIQIFPSKLLQESRIRDVEVAYNEGSTFPQLFHNGIGSIPFDVFSAIFYLISRYEEYLPHKTDKHGRFSPEQSIAYEHSFLNQPIVDIWCIYLKNELRSKFPDLEFKSREFKHIVTIDVDTAYAYKGKGLVRTIGGLVKDFSSLDASNAFHRFRVILGLEKDPYDVFEWVLGQKKMGGFDLIFFYLLGDYEVNDKNVSHKSLLFRSLIKHVNDYAKSGIHPSYASSKDFKLVSIEKERLQEITHMPVTKSRQHFLRFKLPQGYRALLHADITDDYSMAYASEPGFRSGTCTPYQFYDLDLNRTTSLAVHPFPLMEATFKYYKGANETEALERMKTIASSVKEVEGTLYTTWHNDSLSDHGEWKGWKVVFEGLIDYLHRKS